MYYVQREGFIQLFCPILYGRSVEFKGSYRFLCRIKCSGFVQIEWTCKRKVLKCALSNEEKQFLKEIRKYVSALDALQAIFKFMYSNWLKK